MKEDKDDEEAPAKEEIDTTFYVEEWERAFLTDRLHAFMRTPRLIKRYVNVYRLLRAMVEPEEYEEFAKGDRDARHRVVQVLLAISVRFPRLGSELLRALAWPEALPPDASFANWAGFVNRLEVNEQNPKAGLPGALELSPNRREELPELKKLLEGLTEHVPGDIAPWKKWAPVVGRYSMYWQGR